MNRNGYDDILAYNSASQVIAAANESDGGIVLCGYKLADMHYSELYRYLPREFRMLLVASAAKLQECSIGGILCLPMPIHSVELVNTIETMLIESSRPARKRKRYQPKLRTDEEKKIIDDAKALLMERNKLSEEEAHKYIQKDTDTFLIGYNIFDRIAKEGRKYGVLLDIVTQRPVELSDTVIAQCSNFLIFKMTHPLDIEYIRKMLPNISSDVLDKQKVLQPGNCVGFGSAFKINMIIKMEMPNPSPYSNSCNVSARWRLPQQSTNINPSAVASAQAAQNGALPGAINPIMPN